MLIDFHTHCFPDKIAPKAIKGLSEASGGLFPCTDGTTSGLLSAMEQSGTDISVVLNIATNATQQENVNRFAASINNRESLFAFGSCFPKAPDALQKLEDIKEAGLLGVKLHPDYQGFEADAPEMIPIYKKISSLGLITVFHAGFDFGFPPPYGGTPKKLLKALSCFDTPVIAAHWGGLCCGEEVLEYLCGTDIYFDTSFGYSAIPKYYAQKILEKHGTDKILFGTDTPWHSVSMEMRLLNSLGLSENEKDKITFKNALKLLGI